MSYYSIDVEADGQVPGLTGSMVCFGAVKIDDDLNTTFYAQTAPIIDIYDPQALAVSGFTKEEHEKFEDPFEVMHKFYKWIEETNVGGVPIFVSDNPAFDFAYINYYFHKYVGRNPFGWSARRLGDLFCGIMKDARFQWKRKYRKTKHTNNPVDDAKGNAEAMLALRDSLGLKIQLS